MKLLCVVFGVGVRCIYIYYRMEYLRCAIDAASPDCITFVIDDKGLILVNVDMHCYKIVIVDGKVRNAGDDYASQHLVRILCVNKFDVVNENNAFDFVVFLNENLRLINGMCTVCGVGVKSSRIMMCGRCVEGNGGQFLVIDDVVTDAIRRDYGAFNFLLATAYACLSHVNSRNVFDPYPKFIKSEKDLRYNFGSIGELVGEIRKAESDGVLCGVIGYLDYAFIKFVLATNSMDLRSDTLFDAGSKNVFVEQIGDVFLSDDKNVTVLQISRVCGNGVSGMGGGYLFHGSSLSNWYSILRNGIRVYSRTKLMSAGAAFGEGIYLSDSAAFSYNYGVDRYCASKCVAIGVVQVLNAKETYKKAPNIYVVENDKEVVLRYVIIMKGLNNGILQRITKYFTVIKANEVAKSSIDVLRVRMKRVEKELEKLESAGRKLGFGVGIGDSVGDNIVVTIKNTIFQIYFPEDYPLKPPFIWISQLGNSIVNYVVLECGGVLVDELIPSVWKSSVKVSSLMKKLSKCVGDDLIGPNFKNNVFESAFGEYVGRVFRM